MRQTSGTLDTRSQWNLDSGRRKSILSCSLVIANDTLITSDDVVFHPDYPGLEGNTLSTPSMDHPTFLIPYLSRNCPCWYIRPLSFKDLLSICTPQLLIPSDSTLVLSPTLPDLSSMLYESCPCYTSVSIDRHISELLTPSVFDLHYSNIVRCYLNKPLLSVSA